MADQAIPVSRGEPVRLNFPLAPEEDVTGWTFAFTLAVAKNGVEKLYVAEVEVLDEATGSLRVTLPASQTDRELGKYYWDLWRVDSGSERLLAIGYLEISGVVRLPTA